MAISVSTIGMVRAPILFMRGDAIPHRQSEHPLRCQIGFFNVVFS